MRVDVIQQPPYNQGHHQEGGRFKRKGIHRQTDRQFHQSYSIPPSQAKERPWAPGNFSLPSPAPNTPS